MSSGRHRGSVSEKKRFKRTNDRRLEDASSLPLSHHRNVKNADDNESDIVVVGTVSLCIMYYYYYISQGILQRKKGIQKISWLKVEVIKMVMTSALRDVG